MLLGLQSFGVPSWNFPQVILSYHVSNDSFSLQMFDRVRITEYFPKM